ncbi:MAG TPA: peptide chain release factor-like protein, partial [Polyangium sp.]|nr:peptide chain release factor-like protein [Polyangium sp.]
VRRAMSRLGALLRERDAAAARQRENRKWSTHARLERGFPVRTYTLSSRGELWVTGERGVGTN